MERLFVYVVMLFLTLCSQCVQSRRCDVGEYYDMNKGECVVCSMCPNDGDVVRRTCTETEDSICGPFYEFIAFLHEQRQLTASTAGHTASPNQMTSDNEVNSWYNITLALSGVLCFLILLLICLVTVLCVMIHRRQKDLNSDRVLGSESNHDGYQHTHVVVAVDNTCEKMALV